MTALKTVSARIRGSTSDLSDLGEETDDLAQGFSKYARELQALTGFSILEEGTTDDYKDLFEIFDGISQVWDQLTETAQSRVSEILGGTRQLQVISSIMNNWDDAVDAYADAMDDAGTATTANETYLESMTAKVNQFKVAFQELSTTLLDTDFLKGLIDGGTTFLGILNSILSGLNNLNTLGGNLNTGNWGMAGIVGGLALNASGHGVTTWASSISSAFKKEIPAISQEMSSALSQLDEAMGGEFWDTDSIIAYSEAIGVSSDELTAFLKTTDNTAPLMRQYSLSMASASAATSTFSKIASKAVTTIKSIGSAFASMAVMWAVMEAISAITTAIDKYVNRLQYASEAGEEARSTIDSLTSSYQDNAQTVSELSERYAELASGVNSNGTNLSLSDEDYEEYLNISNQLVDIYPSLISYTDSHGNTITNLGNDAESAAAQLEALVEQERILANLEIRNNLDDVIKGAAADAEIAQQALDEATERYEAYSAMLENVAGDMAFDQFESGIMQYYVDPLVEGSNEFANAIREALNDIGVQANGIGTGYYYDDANGYLSAYGLSDEQIAAFQEQLALRTQELTDSWSEAMIEAGADMSAYESQVSSAWSTAQSKFYSALLTDTDYNALSEEAQSAVSQIYSNLDFSEMADWDSSSEIQAYVRKNILGLFDDNTLSQELQEELIGLFTIDRSDMSDADFIELYNSVIESIQEYFDETGVTIDLSNLDFIVANETEMQSRISERLNQLALGSTNGLSGTSASMNYNQAQQDLQSFLASNGIDTTSEYNYFLNVTEGATDAAEAMEMYTKALEDAAEAQNEFDISSVSDDIDDYQSAVSSLASSLSSVSSLSSSDIIDIMQDFSSFDWSSYGVTGQKGVGDLTGALKELISIQVENVDEMLEQAGASDEMRSAFRGMALEGLDASAAIDDANSSLSSLASAYSTVESALQDYAETGYLTIDNLTSLLSLDNVYLAALIDENGQLSINEETYRAMAEAQLDAAEAAAMESAMIDIATISSEGEVSAKAWLMDQNALLVESNEILASSYNDVAVEAAKALSAMGAGQYTQQAIGTVMDSLNARLSLIESTRNSLGSSVSSTLGSGSSGTSSSASSSETAKTIDFFQYRIEELDEAIKLTQTHLDNLNGSSAKNTLIGTLEDIYETQRNDYLQGIEMYTALAEAELEKIPEYMRDAAKNGALSVTDFVGDSASEIAEAIENYRDYADTIADLTEQVAELEATMRQLSVDKFNNIVDDFEKLTGIIDDYAKKIDAIISLEENFGNKVGEGFYDTLIEQTEQKRSILEREYETLNNNLQELLAAGTIKLGSDEWQELQSAINEVDLAIIECTSDIEDFVNAKLEIKVQEFNEIKNAIDGVNDSLDTYITLLDRDTVTTGTTTVELTAEATTTLGLLQQQYELAMEEIELYNKRMDELKKSYENGELSVTEYREQLQDLTSAQNASTVAAKEAKDAILDLIKNAINEVCDAIDAETKAYNDLIDAQKEALKQEKEEADFEKELAEKQEEVYAIQRQIAALGTSDDAETAARRKQLESDLVDAMAELNEFLADHNYEVAIDALDKEAEAYEEAQEERKQTLQDSLNDEETVIAQYLQDVLDNSEVVYQTLTELGIEYGIAIESAVIDPWEAGMQTLDEYAVSLDNSTSLFTEELRRIENEIYEVQNDADAMAYSIIDAMSVSSDGLVSEVKDVAVALNADTAYAQSLSDMLGSVLSANYDTSGITSSINSITSAAGAATTAVNGLMSALTGTSATRYQVVATSEGKTYGTWDFGTDYSAALAFVQEQNRYAQGLGATYQIVTYSKGGRIGKGENDDLNALAQSVGEDVMVAAKEGEYILTKDNADQLFDVLSAISSFTVPMSSGIIDNVKPHAIGDINVDNEVVIQGNVDNTNIKAIQQQIDVSIRQFSRQVLGKVRYA